MRNIVAVGALPGMLTYWRMVKIKPGSGERISHRVIPVGRFVSGIDAVARSTFIDWGQSES